MFLHLRGKQEMFAGQRLNQCLLLDLSKGLTDTSDIDSVQNRVYNSRSGITLHLHCSHHNGLFLYSNRSGYFAL